jgi:ribA/ribD-fused uncharacterized protein
MVTDIAKLYWNMLIKDPTWDSDSNKNIFKIVDNKLVGFNKKNKTEFLSNFYPSPISFEGMLYPTVEHAYQASKTLDKGSKDLIRKSKTPIEAKKLGRSLQLRNDWYDVRIDIMKCLVKEKFENPFLNHLLLETESYSLINENKWNDKFWGVTKGVGENWLGKIIEEVRSEVRKELNESI